MDELAALVRKAGPVCLLCYERDHRHCHRQMIAEIIGRHLHLPVVSISRGEADAHFGWMAHFFSFDVPASSEQTREWLGWRPTHSSLVADLDAGHYFNL